MNKVKAISSILTSVLLASMLMKMFEGVANRINPGIAKLDKSNPKYHSWLGVAYSLNKDYKNERREYLKALSFDKKHLQSLIHLAHNYYDKKEYKKALEYYFRVLDISRENQTVLYHRAMSFQKLGRKAEELVAFKEYLA